MAEEIRGVTYDFDGARLEYFQMAQRFWKAGFKDLELLVECVATMYGESGGYLKAWHHNVVRDSDGNIQRDAQGRLGIKSTDCGLVQHNMPFPSPVWVADDVAANVAETLFAENPELTDGQKQANWAFGMWKNRGFQPWYAHEFWQTPGKLKMAVHAVADFLSVKYGLGKNFFEIVER